MSIARLKFNSTHTHQWETILERNVWFTHTLATRIQICVCVSISFWRWRVCICHRSIRLFKGPSQYASPRFSFFLSRSLRFLWTELTVLLRLTFVYTRIQHMCCNTYILCVPFSLSVSIAQFNCEWVSEWWLLIVFAKFTSIIYYAILLFFLLPQMYFDSHASVKWVIIIYQRTSNEIQYRETPSADTCKKNKDDNNSDDDVHSNNNTNNTKTNTFWPHPNETKRRKKNCNQIALLLSINSYHLDSEVEPSTLKEDKQQQIKSTVSFFIPFTCTTFAFLFLFYLLDSFEMLLKLFDQLINSKKCFLLISSIRISMWRFFLNGIERWMFV